MAGIANHLRTSNRSVFKYVLNKVSFPLITSNEIQKGTTTIMVINKNPNGFQYKAPAISPLISDRTDLVDPQEGQGRVVTRLNIQMPGSAKCLFPCK